LDAVAVVVTEATREIACKSPALHRAGKEHFMNAVSDTLLNRAEDNVETCREEQKTESDAALVELGKVSDTRGGWVGIKTDVGAGFIYY
jgi:hypothetical protein